ncbi:hypothetical protein BD414DRAFT_206737 [Trametes punicea]|nr:hypothetical protein BD414DRAFT_206737 [Trametes punicea]
MNSFTVNNASTDLTLPTSDAVAFKVWRCILAKAPPVSSELCAREDRLAGRGHNDRRLVVIPHSPTLDVPETSSLMFSCASAIPTPIQLSPPSLSPSLARRSITRRAAR